jgi:transcriptional regulator with XRE-family HTH domain
MDALRMDAQNLTKSLASNSFAERITLLIQRVGSASEIARMCGFSEGVVRSWRDGNTDPSRARCVTLARTLGVSLAWLVAGEGSLQATPISPEPDDQHSAESATPHRSQGSLQALDSAAAHGTVDPLRLNTAVRILQSELSLANSLHSLSENTDLLTRLYEILGPGGSHVDPLAMMTFNQQLAERIRKGRNAA